MSGRFDQEAAERRLDAELRAYVDMLTEEKIMAGMSPADARRAALLETGGIEQVKEEVRSVRRGAALDTLRQDMRYTFRRIRREPAFFGFAALIIAVAIGANTAVFSIMNPLLIRPLRFAEPDRLVWIKQSDGEGLSAVTSRSSNLRDYRKLNKSFSGLTGYFAFFDYERFNLVDGDGPPERLVGVGVAGDFLDVLGIQPALGRNFVDEESVWNGRPAAILTHKFWMRRFDGDPSIIGRTLVLNGQPTAVVGVLPASFDFASTFTPTARIDFLRPFPVSDETDQWGNTLALIGRLKPGVTIAQAQADMDDMNRRLTAADRGRWGLGAIVSDLHDHISGDYRRPLQLLAAGGCVVLLIACANLSNLLLARGHRRSRELAVRSALGAQRSRLLRQLATESMLLALCGSMIGVGIAAVLTNSVARLDDLPVPLLDSVAIEGRALLFTLVITVLTGLLLSLAPVLQLLGGREASTLNDASRGSTEGRRSAHVRDLLVIVEVGLACVLLVAGGLLLRSFVRVLDVPLGFEPGGVVEWRVDTERAFENRDAAVAFYDRMVDVVESVPGVMAAGLTDTPPLGRNRGWGIRAEGVAYGDDQWPEAYPRMVDSHYLQVMRIPLRAGRYFTRNDGSQAPRVIIINEMAARTLFPGLDPIGRNVIIPGPRDDGWRVVGVVSDVRHQSLEAGSGLEMYLPITQAPDYSGLTLMVRSNRPLVSIAPQVRAALSSVDPVMPTGDFHTLDSVVARTISPRRFILFVLAGFAAAALLLASIGIYAVVSYAVTQRAPEIGIRMALGESSHSVQLRIVAETARLACAGIALGALLSLAAARLIQSLLYGVQPTDVPTFVTTAAGLLLICSMAGYLPARRASRIDPAVALRARL